MIGCRKKKEKELKGGEVITSLGNVCPFEKSALLFVKPFLIPERRGK